MLHKKITRATVVWLRAVAAVLSVLSSHCRIRERIYPVQYPHHETKLIPEAQAIPFGGRLQQTKLSCHFVNKFDGSRSDSEHCPRSCLDLGVSSDALS